MVRIAQKNKKGGGFPQEQCVCVFVFGAHVVVRVDMVGTNHNKVLTL